MQYSTCDIILLFQIYYYRRTNKKTPLPSGATAETDVAEDTPLLTAESAARSSTTTTTSLKRKILQYSAAITFICAAGVVAWAISEKVVDGSEPSDRKEVLEWKSQLLGWLSAVLFCESNESYSLFNERSADNMVFRRSGGSCTTDT